MITDADAVAARARIAGHLRRTPLIEATQLRQPPTEGRLLLKLECLQVTGSFKARGATNKLLSMPHADLMRGIVTASGGNHGLAVARAARTAGVPGTIFVPATASAAKVAALRGWDADVRVVGSVWDESNAAAQALCAATGAAYFHPFADPAVVAGQGTLALDLLDDAPPPDCVIIAIGGGGLIAGMATVLRARAPGIRIIGVEPVGAPTLHASLRAGHVVTLPAVTTRVATMAAARTDERVFQTVRALVDEIVLVDDAAMEAAARWLWHEMAVAADLSGAAAIAALRTGAVRVAHGTTVCAIVCGAGPEGTLAAG